MLRVEDICRPSIHPAAIAFPPCALLAYICVCDYNFTPQQTAYFLKLSYRKFDILFERAKKLIEDKEHPLSIKREIVLEILKTNQRYKRTDNEDNR